MELTKKELNKLKDKGKEICIYSKQISIKLKEYDPINFKNFSRTSFYFWKTNKRPIPLSIIKKIIEEKNLSKINIDSFSINGGNKVVFPKKDSKEFCYVLGLILGDGCLVHRKRSENRNTYLIKIAFRKFEKAKEIGLLIKNMFGKMPSIYQGKGCYELCLHSKPLVLILNKLYDIPIGEKYESIRIPKCVIKGKRSFKVAFIKGIFESDGNIYEHRSRKCVQLRQKSCKFLKEIKELSKNLGIEFRDPYYDKANNSWVLWSSKKELTDNFIKKIVNFNVDGPVAQLDRALAF